MKFRARTLGIVTAAILSMAASSGLGQPAWAGGPAGTISVWQVADGNERFSVSGKVESVSYASNTVRIGSGAQTVDILVTPTTVIEIHGEAGSIADIRKGSKITASGIVRSGQKIALSIVLK